MLTDLASKRKICHQSPWGSELVVAISPVLLVWPFRSVIRVLSTMQLRVDIVGAIEPLDRGERFELPLIRFLEPLGGDIIGSGTLVLGREIAGSDIVLEVPDENALQHVFEILRTGRIPPGSSVSRLTETGDWVLIRQF